MRKYFLLTFVVLCFVVSCKSRIKATENIPIIPKKEVNYIPYFLKVYEADSLYLVKNYQKSYAVLDSLFKKFKPLNTEQYKEYETYLSCAFAIDKKINFKDSILKSIENYGSNSRYFKYDSLMDLAYKSAKISNEDIVNSTRIYRNKLNFTLRDSIQEMCRVDQEVRNDGRTFDNSIRIVDSLNQIKLEHIFTKYGYPSEKLIGEFYIDSTFTDLSVIFLHTNREFRMNFLLPKVLDAVKKGQIYPEFYSQSYDRFLEYTTGKQLYGSYNLTREKQETEFTDKENIDSLRKSIGLPSRTYKRWRFKIKYERIKNK